jgi:hypothetical protein
MKLQVLFAPPRSRCFALLLVLVAALCVQRGEAQASSQGGMFYGAAGGVFGPSYQCVLTRTPPSLFPPIHVLVFRQLR